MTSATPLLADTASAFAADVKKGLGASPKYLPAKYFYDALGSQLFEAICLLREYPITRAETMLLELYASEMVAPLGKIDALVELGCGSGMKLAVIAKALVGQFDGSAARSVEGRGPLDVHLVDVSAQAIEMSSHAMAELSFVNVTGHAETYDEGLARLARTKMSGTKLILFLGSNIGNFEPQDAAAFLKTIRASLHPGDGLLLGADLVRAEADLVAAYDDPLGVTAAFDKNMLSRINAELGGDFDLRAFDHEARWVARASRVEMHLVSRRDQTVQIPGADTLAHFAPGESIWTESSHKYSPERLADLGRAAGLHPQQQWVEPDGRFCTTLFLAGPRKTLRPKA